MSEVRPARHGPTWRSPLAPELDERRALVLCRCGVDMAFLWPADARAVRCCCGRWFERPQHLPAVDEPSPWRPPGVRPPLRERLWRRRDELGVAALCLLLAGFLGAGLALLAD